MANGSTSRNEANDRMEGKVCLVTGGNAGIGKETAIALARLGAIVTIVARDPGRGEAALAEIRRRSESDAVHLLVADLSSQRQIRELADAVLAQSDRLDVLVNNAGAINGVRSLTEDGYETTFAVNHLAYFLLTHLFYDRLKASSPSRIVNVASDAHHSGHIDFENLNGEQRYNGWSAYCASKLANVMFTLELARRIEGNGVTANALHPGVIASGFGREGAWYFRLAILLARPFMRNEGQGAETSIHLASSPDVEGITGTYFANCSPARSSTESLDRAKQARLWEESERMTHPLPSIP